MKGSRPIIDMTYHKDILIILAVAFILSLSGFVIDLHERVPDIMVNIFEILMMTGIIFGAIAFVCFPLKFIATIFSKPEQRGT